ncbi:MAG: heavy metal translocating P-type ATPase [Methylophilaceae bacterium]
MQAVIENELESPNIATKVATNDWVALDEPDEWSSFSVALEGKDNQWESHLAIEGMHCASCAINIEKAVKAVPGILSTDVSSTSGRARVVWSSEQTKPSAWMLAVSNAGYRVLPAADGLMHDDRRKKQRLMLWRLLVAGFCMLQVMMYAMPAYFARPGEMTEDALNLMRWASWVLTLPVLFFSCGPFYKSALIDLKQHQISMDMPVALGITITFLVSSAATFDPAGWWGSEVYFDSLTMLVFFLLTGRWIELRMRDKTAGALDVLMRRLPSSVERLKPDGTFERIAVRRLTVGDEVRVLPGEAFPADGVVTLGSTSADESLLTGESKSVQKGVGAEVIAGSHNLSANVQMRIENIGQSTRYAQIVALMERAAVDKPRLAILADRIARPFLVMVLLAALGSALYLWQVDHSRALMAAAAVLIVTCPCALSLATPAAMLTVSGALARSGVLVRKMQAFEALAKVDTIVFDKTGTLTIDRMTVGHITTAKKLNKAKALALASAMAQYSLHPVSRALVEMTKVTEEHLVDNVQEISGAGLTADSSLGQLKLGNAQFCQLADTHVKTNDSTNVHLVSDAGWLASFEIVESIKSDAASTIHQLNKNGVKVEVLSGDRLASVQNVANIVGINHVFGDCSPQDKLTHIQTLQNQGRSVLMVGDGLNDGPVLASANVSIAMGQAVPLAQAQSDFVVMNGQLSVVTHLLKQAKRTMGIVKQNLIWAATYNAVCVPLAVAGMLPAWLAGLGMALSSLLVILNASRLSRDQLTGWETV